MLYKRIDCWCESLHLFVSTGVIVHMLTPNILFALSSDPSLSSLRYFALSSDPVLKIRPTLSFDDAQRKVRTDDNQIAPPDSCNDRRPPPAGKIDGLASCYKPAAGKRNLIGLYDNFNRYNTQVV